MLGSIQTEVDKGASARNGILAAWQRVCRIGA